jgi:hypothetical protein
MHGCAGQCGLGHLALPVDRGGSVVKLVEEFYPTGQGGIVFQDLLFPPVRALRLIAFFFDSYIINSHVFKAI